MPDAKKFEKQFFNALRDIFVGAKVEGESGYVNLMRIKSRYYEQGVFPQLHKDINAALLPFPDFREELFDKLYTFFQRYFSESGSIYFRYTALHQNVYEKVYTDDRDVILFWKTHMLYYVKTDRIFTSLNVEVDGAKFFFDAGKMTLKKSNEKREVIYTFRKAQEDGTLVFDVTYSEKGKTTKVDDILKELKKAGGKLSDETLNKAFRVFEKQSEVDYFINKNARAFLQEQFDLWMYQYLFAGQNIWGAERLAQLQALKSIAYKVIDFISQFEDELVKIWNKPKFVRNSHYVLTLNHVIARSAATKQSEGEDSQTASGKERPRNDRPALLDKLLAHPNLPQQVQEWRDLGMIGEDFQVEMLTQKDLTDAPLYPQYQYLPVDTRYFTDLELEVLGLFDDLDASLDGWLVHSENYQAINTLLAKFQRQVQIVYIDPPYNTAASEIDYVNNYKDAAWLSLIENRLRVTVQLMSQEAILCLTIDDYELHRLKTLVDSINGLEIIGTVAIKNSPSGRPTVKGFRINHEYAVFMAVDKDVEIGQLDKSEDQMALFKENDDKGLYQWVNLRKRGGANTLRVARPKQFYPIYVCGDEIRIPKMEWNKEKRDWDILDDPRNDEIVLYPIGDDGKERIWSLGHDTAQSQIKNLQVRRKGNSVFVFRKLYLTSSGSLPSTWWDSTKYFTVENGTGLLENILGTHQAFAFPKSVYAVEDCLRVAGAENENAIVLDFFAGSGTTSHAVMNINRADSGKRKYILVEMGEHFNTVILPRVKKVAFCSKWKVGKPVFDKGEGGLSHFVKYYYMEQYEDILRCAHYADADLFNNPYEDPYHRYVFLRDVKLLDSIEIDADQNKVHFHPERLYPDPSSPFGTSIDLAETLSQRRGKWIKRITAEYVEFQDGETVSLTDPDWQLIKPLVWW